ncbi:MAG: LysO family transporter [Anaerolineaceae bacterium]|nr:LysO family transporter [Anaerolineaceae bacterium]
MAGIIIIFVIGIGAGLLFRGNERLKKRIQFITNIDLCLLLFVLGLSIGKEDGLMHKLDVIGYQSFILAIGTILGSILLVYPLYLRAFKGQS